MLTEEQVQEICEWVKAKVCKETGIRRQRVNLILDRDIDPRPGELKKIKKVLSQIFPKLGCKEVS